MSTSAQQPDARHSWSRAAATLGRDVGLALHLSAALALASVLVAAIAGDTWAIVPLVVCGSGALAVGQLLHRSFERTTQHTTRTAIAVVASAWVVTGLVAALVLWWLAAEGGAANDAVTVYRDPLNALFEGVSGITSTGLTMADGLESALPATVQWWRSLLQWIGAVGVVLFTLALTSTGASGALLYESATRPEMLSQEPRTAARRIWTVYIGLTVASITGLWAAGLDAWTALNHGMTAIATGGFTITDDSFGAHPPVARVVAIVVLLAGATSFVAHYQLLVRRDLRAFLRRTQVRALAVGVLVGVPLLAIALRGQEAPVAVVDVVFQWATALGTAGFDTVDLEAWGPAALLLLIVAMTIGGASGSTAGGLKLSRVSWLAKALMTRIRTAEPCGEHGEHAWDGQRIGPDESRRAEAHAGGMALLWLMTLMGGAFLMLLLVPGKRPDAVLFDVTSALSNVGLDTGIVGRDLGWAPKTTIIVVMLLGRLEILGVLVLLRTVVVHGGREATEGDRPPPGA